uniref:Uncharacterized protein n=1 Tax=Thermofilum adornatum TaxID=1365176 RepID=A0A7C1GBX9_9CREN
MRGWTSSSCAPSRRRRQLASRRARIIEMPGLSILAAIIFYSLIYIMAAVVVLASTWQTESNLNKY